MTRFGPDHWNYKNGKTVRPQHAYLTPRVYEQFERHMADERLLDLRPDIALMEVLKGEAARSLETGESAAAWAEAGAILRTAVEVPGVREMRGLVRTAIGVMAGGAAQAMAREEVGRVLERRGRLVATYRRLLVETGDLIPAARVAVVLAQLAALTREFLKTDDERREFHRRFVGLLGPHLRPDASRPGTGGNGNGGPPDHG
jgi:hypothetical protein